MDDDEQFAQVFNAVVVLAAAVRHYSALLTVYPRRGRMGLTVALAITPPACLCGLYAVLRTLADPQVRHRPAYLSLFLAAGAVWMAATAEALPYVAGVSVRDDAIERRNPAATVLACAALVAATIVFAGANVGTGATIWTTLGPTALGAAGLLLTWLAYALLTDSADAIAIGRDTATALRTGGFYLGAAAVLARAVAGNYTSAADTLRDFARFGWPAVALLFVAVALVEPTAGGEPTGRVANGRAVLIAAGYVVAGCVMAAVVPWVPGWFK